MNDFQNEWAIIHASIEKYESLSLLIKLLSIVVCILSIALSINELIAIFIALVLWLQDGIWKTFQKRLEMRVLFVEQRLKNEANSEGAFQLYSQWQENRLGAVSLVKEYLLNSLKPTVAYPYIVLIFLLFIIFQVG